MENKKKCSMIDHKENDSISFCYNCKIYMCNKCEKTHSELFKNKHQYVNINHKNIDGLFTGLCKEKNHLDELIYFCKDHNILCCAHCITKIKGKENGQHTDCQICFLEDIENDKKNKLIENIKSLEDLSKTLQQTIDDLKKIFNNINEKKETLKMNIQKLFTKLRNVLNDREDKLLLEVDKKYEELYFNEDIIRESEKLPTKIKESLDKGNLINKQWNNNKLNSSINDCLNIENNIKIINKINDRVKKCNSIKSEIYFYPKDNEINKLLESLQNFGDINEGKPKVFDSVIDFDEQLVKPWLNYRQFSTELLFRKTRDGSTPNDFHNKCDNKGITIVFIETTNGYKFGGYTELEWDHSGNKKDKSTFIFSFNNKEKYNARNNNNSIGCYSFEGPRFGSDYPEIYLYSSLNQGRSFDNSRYNTFLLGRKLTNGEEYWDVKELEVHKISYI